MQLFASAATLYPPFLRLLRLYVSQTRLTLRVKELPAAVAFSVSPRCAFVSMTIRMTCLKRQPNRFNEHNPLLRRALVVLIRSHLKQLPLLRLQFLLRQPTLIHLARLLLP